MSEVTTGGVPTFEQRQEMWRCVTFAPDEAAYPRTSEFVTALSAVFTNGRALHRSFRLPEHPTFDWYASRNRFHEMGFFERFWQCPCVCAAIPQQLHSLNFYSREVFEWSSSFMLAGSLAWALADGGAYTRHSKGSVDAKRLADAAADELIASDYDRSLLFTSHTAWSDFFLDVAWDCTWVLVHLPQKRVHVLLATDTD